MAILVITSRKITDIHPLLQVFFNKKQEIEKGTPEGVPSAEISLVVTQMKTAQI